MELNTIAAYGSSVASPENPNMCKQETGKDSSNQFLKFSSEPLDFDMIHSRPINHPIF